MNKCDLLRKGKEELVKRNLCKGFYYKKNGKEINTQRGEIAAEADAVCVLGALRIAYDWNSKSAASTPPFEDVYFQAYDLLHKVTNPLELTMLNDRPETTKEVMLKVFDDAIELGGCNEQPF